MIKLILFALVSVPSCSAQVQAKSDRSHFQEDEFESSQTISPDVLKAILSTKEAKSNLSDLNQDERKNPANLFHEIEVHLGPANEVDLIVRGSGKMSGVDNSWFWIVRMTPTGPKVVLWTGCLSIVLSSKRTMGFREIKTQWASAAVDKTEWFRFDGLRYRSIKSRYTSK